MLTNTSRGYTPRMVLILSVCLREIWLKFFAGLLVCMNHYATYLLQLSTSFLHPVRDQESVGRPTSSTSIARAHLKSYHILLNAPTCETLTFTGCTQWTSCKANHFKYHNKHKNGPAKQMFEPVRGNLQACGLLSLKRNYVPSAYLLASLEFLSHNYTYWPTQVLYNFKLAYKKRWILSCFWCGLTHVARTSFTGLAKNLKLFLLYLVEHTPSQKKFQIKATDLKTACLQAYCVSCINYFYCKNIFIKIYFSLYCVYGLWCINGQQRLVSTYHIANLIKIRSIVSYMKHVDK
jgi:hypothetical protein